MSFPEPLQKLIDEFCRFPGIGPKTAQRLSFFLLGRPREEAASLAKAIVAAKDGLRFCSQCGALTVTDPCRYCSDPRREQKLFCVVQEPRDLLRLEQAGNYRGLYHVLHGALSPLDGLGPEELRLPQLLERLSRKEAEELIVATNPNVEGDATAAYIARLVKPLKIRVTRIAFGLPVGGDLEYADDLTLSRALEGRREI
ncbi:MAG TPA: recombination protein RecR [Firmicutes bacterium]|jgi:recombination protein RecR|nr:recombination protein RecR [Bacillota bacterium]